MLLNQIKSNLFQKSCISFAIEAKPMELYVPPETTGIRYHIWRLVTSQPFENFIMLLILMNTILLMLKVLILLSSVIRPLKSNHYIQFKLEVKSEVLNLIKNWSNFDTLGRHNLIQQVIGQAVAALLN